MLFKHLEFIDLIVFETIFSISCICFFQVKCSSRITPRNFKEFTLSMMLQFSRNEGNFKGISSDL